MDPNGAAHIQPTLDQVGVGTSMSTQILSYSFWTWVFGQQVTFPEKDSFIDICVLCLEEFQQNSERGRRLIDGGD